MRTLIFLSLALWVFVACGPETSEEEAQAQQEAEAPVAPPATLGIEQNTWILESYGPEEDPTQVPGGVQATISFQRGEEPMVGGMAGCNNFFGAYRLTEDSLVINGPLGTTMKMCEPDHMEVEKNYLQLLESSETFSLVGIGFQVHCSGGNVLNFRLKQ